LLPYAQSSKGSGKKPRAAWSIPATEEGAISDCLRLNERLLAHKEENKKNETFIREVQHGGKEASRKR